MQIVKKSLAIHAHFYQPPRINPFTHTIPDDDNVKGWTNGKYKNWNEVIHNECYKPNADLGNFDLISYDLFRSLAEWMEKYDRNTYDKIIAADQHNYITYGYGNAFAYPYDHAILPLLSEDDIDVEVFWGIADFFKRYKHMPVAFWLPETGVDLKTLRILEKNGIRFTILAPWQGQPVDNARQIDSGALYKTNLGHGKVMHMFFYDGPLSGDLSFNDVQMANADTFVNEYLSTIIQKPFNVAALDGERFGHHLKGGEQFLKEMLRDLFNNSQIQTMNIIKEYFSLTNASTVKIYENSAWSCHHGGLKRWQADCDCSYDDTHHQRTNGYWKTALLSAFRVLAAQIDIYFNEYAKNLVRDVLLLKREYIHVLLADKDFKGFITEHQIRPLSFEDDNKLKVLLDMQKYKLAMFTSCAFFFADLDRPEPRINIWNAKKALSLFKVIGEEEMTEKLERDFLHQLEEIYSNFSGKNGQDLYFEDGIHL